MFSWTVLLSRPRISLFLLPMALIVMNIDSATNPCIVATHCTYEDSFNFVVSRVLESLTTLYNETKLMLPKLQSSFKSFTRTEILRYTTVDMEDTVSIPESTLLTLYVFHSYVIGCSPTAVHFSIFVSSLSSRTYTVFSAGNSTI